MFLGKHALSLVVNFGNDMRTLPPPTPFPVFTHTASDKLENLACERVSTNFNIIQVMITW